MNEPSASPLSSHAMTWEQAVQWLRQQPDQNALVRACYYDDPLLQAAERFHRGSEWSATRALLPHEKGAALDLGAGRGISSYALAHDGWNVTALEPDPSELVGAGAIRDLARQSGLPIAIEVTRSEKLPFADSSFELVYGRQVLHHTRDLRLSCREIARVLKPGGLAVATREHVISKQEDLPKFLESHPLHRYYGGESAYRCDEYVSALGTAGLEIVRVLGPYDSPINYFPLTNPEHVAECVKVLPARIAGSIHHRLLSPPGRIGAFLLRRLASMRSHRDETPGRNFSFVARKPAR